MLTKQDFLDKAYAEIDKYPQIAALYRAGDPRITQHIEAIATMLAMQSQQQEAAMMEVFAKERTSTILADAAMRGIVPRAKGVRVQLLVTNPGLETLTLAQDRVVSDSSGNEYRLEMPVSVPAGQTLPVIARQGSTVVIRHVVADTIPFYPIEVPPASDGAYLSFIQVQDATGMMDWGTEYTNVAPGDRIYHVEVDERQRVYVRFGFKDVVGVQPQNGDTITLTVGYAIGDVAPQAQSPFSLDYANALEAGAKIVMDSVVQRGENPVDVDTLRDYARYPSIYSESAVFMGEFDYLARKKFTTLEFVSVWNEAQEEAARGAHVDNINALFVAMRSRDGAEPVILQAAGAPIAPMRIDNAALSVMQKNVKKAVLNADDSYRIYFVTPVQAHIFVQVHARVAPSYVASDVQSQIRALILREYGSSSAPARKGYNRPLHQQIYALLRKSVPALAGGGDADWTVHIDMPTEWGKRPELWMFVADASLTVTVETANIVQPTWGV